MRQWALDANIVMGQGVRRLICAAVELSGGQVVIPAQVLEMVRLRYSEVARKRAIQTRGWSWSARGARPPGVSAEPDAGTLARRGRPAGWSAGWATAF